MTDAILDLFERAASGSGRVNFTSGGPAQVGFAEIWRRAGHMAAWLDGAGVPGRVGAVLGTSDHSLVALAAVWRSGRDLVSLPHPARAMRPEAYIAQLDQLAALTECGLLLVPDVMTVLADACRTPMVPISSAYADGSVDGDRGGGKLIQFTSGTTSSPRGVVLAPDALLASARATIASMQAERAVVCSWMPLSHDAGLVGTVVCSWVAAGDGVPISLTLIPPEEFIGRPRVWLETCTEQRATHTASPPLGLKLALRHVDRSSALDLHALESILVGAEAVEPSLLQEFEAAFGPVGLRATALSPCYGLAEASAAVAMSGRDERWRARDVLDPFGGEEPLNVVSSGRALPGFDVRLRSTPDLQGSAGELEVRSATLLEELLGGDDPRTDDGWLRTKDVAVLDGDEVVVIGRTDDVMAVRGKKYSATEVERVVEEHAFVRRGETAVFVLDGTVIVLAELADKDVSDGLTEQLDSIGRSVSQRFGFRPGVLAFVRRGCLPKTPSGKTARHAVRARWINDEIDVLHVARPTGRVP